MKKIFCTLLVLCLCFAFTGCSHEHEFETMWSIGIDAHWHSCEKCGEQADFAAHTFGDDGTCTVCTAGIYDTESGLKEAKAYDDHGSLVLYVTYDSENNEQSDERYVYEYYDDGNVKNQKFYRNRVLATEDVYQYCTDPQNGELYKSESYYYYADVSTVKTEYNEKGHLLLITTYDANGKVHSIDRYEYEFDADGNRIKLSIYTNDTLVRVFDDVNNKLYDYDAYGLIKLERTYVYDDNGTLIKEIIHIYGELDQENYYATNEDGTQYVYKMVFYDENGQIEKESQYDPNGNEIK